MIKTETFHSSSRALVTHIREFNSGFQAGQTHTATEYNAITKKRLEIMEEVRAFGEKYDMPTALVLLYMTALVQFTNNNDDKQGV